VPAAQLPAALLPMKVGLVKGDPFPPLEGGHCMGLIGQPYVETRIDDYYEAGFIAALSNYFQSVSAVDSMDAGEHVDVLAKVDRSFPDSVGLSFYDAKTKALLQDLREPFDPDPQHLLTEPCDGVVLTLSSLFWDTIAWDILFPVWCKFAEDHDYKAALGSMKPRLSNAMSLVSQKAASSPTIANFQSGPKAPDSRSHTQDKAPSEGQQPWWKQ